MSKDLMKAVLALGTGTLMGVITFKAVTRSFIKSEEETSIDVEDVEEEEILPDLDPEE